MTLNDIIVAALAQLDRGHDAQTLDVWRDKFARFANDGAADLAHAVKPRRTEAARIRDGLIDIFTLERRCLKVVGASRGGKELAFRRGGSTGALSFAGVPDGEAEITYEYLPRELSAATDVPELPEACHALIVTYVVARERASGDVSVQRGAGVYFQLYEAGKRLIRPHPGCPDAHRIVNRW